MFKKSIPWVLLTGGIGSGKTTISGFFAQQNVPVIDTDVIAHELTCSPGTAIEEIEACFGQEAINDHGLLNRAWMRHKIFNDQRAKKWLEFILHPKIFSQVLSLQKQAQGIYGILVVPVFSADSIYNAILNRVLYVDVDPTWQITQVCQRDDLSEAQVRNIMHQQLSREQGLKLADDVVRNNGNLSELQAKVFSQHRTYLDLFGHPSV